MVIGNIGGAIAGIIDTGVTYASARRSERFQKAMYNTRYQRTMADMRAAGLNPMLAYSQGVGAAPRGPGAIKYDGATKGVATALAVKRVMAELQNIRQDTELKDEQTWLTRTNASIAAVEHDIREQNLSTAKAAATGAQIEEAFLKTRWGKVMKWIGLTGREANPFASSARSSRAAATKPRR